MHIVRTPKKIHSVSKKWAAAGSVNIGLSFLSFLKLYRADVAERQIAPGRAAKPHDEIEYIRARLLPGPVDLSGCALGF